MNQNRLIAIMSGRERGATASLTRAGLSVLEPFYALGVGLRNATFDLGLRRQASLGRPVVSVGNITTGGTGKTPMVVALARRLQKLGHKPAVLLRGYRAEANHAIVGSDEAAVLRGELGEGVPVEPDPNRVAAAQRVLLADPSVSVFLLDDGFQHRKVARDVDLLLIDAVNPFGGGRLLPRGFLREPVRRIARASALIVTRSDQVEERELAELDGRLRRITGKPPVAHAAHTWTALRDAQGNLHPLEVLRNQHVASSCAIGNPEAFERMLRRHCGHLAFAFRLPDHWAYTPTDVRQAIDAAMKAKAQCLVMTEKDWVKWHPAAEEVPVSMPVFRPVLEMDFLDGEDEVVKAISDL